MASCGDEESTPPPPREFFGVVAEDVLALDAERDAGLRRIAATGVGLLRETFDWALIETRPGTFDFSATDRQVAAAARRDLALLPIVFNTPPFRASGRPRGTEPLTFPPRRPGDIGPLLAALVGRYGPAGEFWRERDDVPRRPIRAWQIWNEPNLGTFWANAPDPAEYTRLLKAAARAIRAADPSATVVSGGLPESKSALPRRTFLAGMIAAGALDALDAVGVHAYARDADLAIAGVEEVRTVLDRAESDADIWVTEVGWATQGPRSPFTVGRQGQARRIKEFLTEATEEREELGLRGVVYFNWRDSRPPVGIRDFFGLHSGLLSRSGSAKPGLEEFIATIRSLRGG